MTEQLAGLLQDGRLRAAINTANRALVQVKGDRLDGVSPALAQRLADTLGVRLEPVVYDGAGKVFADAGRNVWDVAFLAIDLQRAASVSFTRPYHRIEATFAVRAGAAIKDVDEVDRPGAVIVSSAGSAYDLYLDGTLRHATRSQAASPGDSFAAFRSGQGDAVAGIRAALDRQFGMDPAYRILPGVLATVDQAMCLPGSAHPAIEALDAFLAEAIEEGFVTAQLGDG